jgi:hypothetical protein
MREFYDPFKARIDQAMAAAAAERRPAARPGAGAAKSGKQGGRKRSGGQSKSLPKSEKEGQVCPHCQEGTLAVKQGKFGPFLGCSRYALGCTYTEKLSQNGRRTRSRRRKKSG